MPDGTPAGSGSQSQLDPTPSVSSIPNVPGDSLVFTSVKRDELRRWFRARAPSLSGAYEGAIRMLDDPEFPGRIHFIGHAIRDITNRLAFVLNTQLQGRRVQYEDRMDAIAEEWPGLALLDADGDGANDHVPMPVAVARRIDSLVNDHRNRREQPSNFDLLFQHLASENPNRGPVNVRIVQEFKRVHNWFMDRTHLPRTEGQIVPEDELRQQFQRFEAMLYAFVGDFFTGRAELDNVLQQANR